MCLTMLSDCLGITLIKNVSRSKFAFFLDPHFRIFCQLGIYILRSFQKILRNYQNFYLLSINLLSISRCFKNHRNYR